MCIMLQYQYQFVTQNLTKMYTSKNQFWWENDISRSWNSLKRVIPSNNLPAKGFQSLVSQHDSPGFYSQHDFTAQLTNQLEVLLQPLRTPLFNQHCCCLLYTNLRTCSLGKLPLCVQHTTTTREVWHTLGVAPGFQMAFSTVPPSHQRPSQNQGTSNLGTFWSPSSILT